MDVVLQNKFYKGKKKISTDYNRAILFYCLSHAPLPTNTRELSFQMLVGLKTRLKKNKDEKYLNLYSLSLTAILFRQTCTGLYVHAPMFPGKMVFKG